MLHMGSHTPWSRVSGRQVVVVWWVESQEVKMWPNAQPGRLVGLLYRGWRSEFTAESAYHAGETH